MHRIMALSFFLLALLAPAAVLAQGFVPANPAQWAFADDYGRWTLQGQAKNTFTFTPAQSVNGCQVTNYVGNSLQFYAFSNSVGFGPILINDLEAANSEIVTPTTAFTPTQVTCGVNLSPTNQHTTFALQSGTAGLQEAINALGASTAPYPTVIYLTPQWYKLVSGIASLNSTLAGTTPASIIAAAVCTTKVIVVDITKTPATTYGCVGGALNVVVQHTASY
jgi:hypothetical protein